MIIDHLPVVSLSKSSRFEFFSLLIESQTLSRGTNAFPSFSVRQGNSKLIKTVKLFTLTAISAVISGLPVWKVHHLNHSLDDMKSVLSRCSSLHAHNNIWSLKYPCFFHQPNPRADHCIRLNSTNWYHIAPWNLSLFITAHRKRLHQLLYPSYYQANTCRIFCLVIR